MRRSLPLIAVLLVLAGPAWAAKDKSTLLNELYYQWSAPINQVYPAYAFVGKFLPPVLAAAGGARVLEMLFARRPRF